MLLIIMKCFSPNKVWQVIISTPLLSTHIYAAVDEPTAALAPIIVQAEMNDDITEHSKKYKKDKS